ncbi:hypothetical protein FDUTEX481_03332 [Tolypothrix sp. PCC 7601]|nr:hypothetical protein FDUTEX481_03332 [Tolypothrix sp. PCC 7601]
MFGVWGLICPLVPLSPVPNPQSPIPSPQSPVPSPQPPTPEFSLSIFSYKMGGFEGNIDPKITKNPEIYIN